MGRERGQRTQSYAHREAEIAQRLSAPLVPNSSGARRCGVLKTYQGKHLALETKNFLEAWLGRSLKLTEGAG